MSNIIHYIGEILNKKVIVAVKVKNGDGRYSLHTMREMLGDKTVLKKLNDNGASLLYTVIESKKSVPGITVSAKPQDIKMLGASPMVAGVASIKGDKETERNEINKIIDKQGELNLTLTEYEEICKDVAGCVLDSLKSELYIEVEPTALKTPTDMPKLMSFKVNIKEDGKRIKRATYENFVMSEPSDTVMFRLSKHEQINNAIQQADLPSLRYPDFKKYIPFFRGVKGMDSKSWERHLKMFGDGKLTKEDVIGYTTNNDLDIQDNEKDFYNQIVNLIKEGVSKERDVSMAEVDKLLEDGITSNNVNTYLMELITLALYQTRNYSGKVIVPSHIIATDDEEDDEDSSGSDEDSNSVAGGAIDSYYFYDDKGSIKQMNTPESVINAVHGFSALDALTAYVKKAVNNPFALAEALIKLIRWGERKPASLAIKGVEKNGNQLYLDLTEFKETTFSGDWNKEVPKVVNGFKYIIKGKIVVYGSVGSLAYMRTKREYSSEGDVPAQFDVIAGIQLIVQYEGGQQQHVYMDINTFIEHVKAQEDGEKIWGTEYDKVKDKIIISEGAEEAFNSSAILTGTVITEEAKSVDGSSYIEVNKELMDLAMSIDGLDISGTNIFSIWNQFVESKDLQSQMEKGQFSTREEMLGGLRNRDFVSGTEALTVKALATVADTILYVQQAQLAEDIRDSNLVGLEKAIELFGQANCVKNKYSKSKEEVKQEVKLESKQVEEDNVQEAVPDITCTYSGNKTDIMGNNSKAKLERAIPLAESADATPIAWLVQNPDKSFNLYSVAEVEVLSKTQFVPLAQLATINKLRTANPKAFESKFKVHSSETMMQINVKYNELYS